jgi:TonB C terminal
MTEHTVSSGGFGRSLPALLAVVVFLTTACATPVPPPTVTAPALDSSEGSYAPYVAHLRQQISKHWRYPCLATAGACEYKDAELDVEFGVLESGQLQFVEVVRSSGFATYDSYRSDRAHGGGGRLARVAGCRATLPAARSGRLRTGDDG